jgi:hypothetical protein
MKALVALAVSAFSLAACHYLVPLSSPITQPPLVAPIRGTIDVFYPAEFRTYDCKAGKGYLFDTFQIDLGAQSVTMFDRILEGLFEHIEHVERDPDFAGGSRAHPAIRLRLVRFTGCEAKWPIVGTTAIDIEYDADIYTRTGKAIAQITARGHADAFDIPTDASSDESQYLGRLTGAAMRKAAASFVADFQRREDIREALNAESSTQP